VHSYASLRFTRRVAIAIFGKVAWYKLLQHFQLLLVRRASQLFQARLLLTPLIVPIHHGEVWDVLTSGDRAQSCDLAVLTDE